MSTPPKPGAPKARSLDNNENRVILLLDMDCFYAQCETVRLGLDPELPLALIQVRRGIIVAYVSPHRTYSINYDCV
jgi:DNA polymerase eta